MAAVSLNLIMGFGGMVSFGHAAYIGIGGYAVGILAHEGVHVGLRAVAAGARRLGPVRARHRRAQPAHARRLLHHDHAGVRADDLLRGGRRSTATAATTASPSTAAASSAASSISPTRPCSTICASSCCSAAVYLVWRLVNSRFGLVIQGSRSNDRRMRAIGFPTFRYRLDLLRHRRHHLRPVRRAARQPHRLHQPGHDALDALGRPHRHGRAGRHGLGVRPADRRRWRCCCWRRRCPG